MGDRLRAHQATVAFYVAHLLSSLGFEFAFFVMTLHVYGKRGQASDVAIFSTLTFLPRLFAPLLGTLVDRFPQERLFAAALALGAGLTVLLPFTRRELGPWTCIAILAVLFGLVRTTLLTRVAVDRGYLKGNSAMLVSLNAARLGAPVAGAAAAACLTFRASLFWAGTTFLVAALFAGRVKITGTAEAQPRTRERFVPAFLKGFTELWRVDELRFLFLLSLVWRLFLGLQISLFIVFIRRSLGGSDPDYGVFMTCVGLGSVSGSLAGPWLARRVPAPLLVKAGMGLHFAMFIALSRITSLAAALLVATAGFSILYASVVAAHSLRDRIVPEALRGRVFGADTALLSIAGMASMLAGGRLADAHGVNAVFQSAGALSLLSLYALHRLARPLEAGRRTEA